MPVAPHPSPVVEGLSGLHTCAEIARDIFLGVRCADTARGTAHGMDSGRVPPQPYPRCKGQRT
ncbi:hypothetical protein [Streptomyces sp. NPDC059003]|uniref:hypothetical protein n=1 Tax=Streptomyces sp. NPDC059003 TaxID=3346691 RepID=UPI0036900006